MNFKKNIKGFTLIELLVVIGILAVLAAGVVALIDPVEKTRQANDAKIISDIGEFGVAMQSFAATQMDGSYPCATAGANCPNTQASGINAVGPAAVNGSGDLARVPVPPANSTPNPYGFVSSGNARPVANVVVYGGLTSRKYISKCASGTAYWMFSSGQGRSCGVCAIPVVNTTCATNF